MRPYDGGMRIRLAIVNDYEVVVRGLAEMLRPSEVFDIVELTSQREVEHDVDIALYDTFAQTQGDGPGVGELLENPRVSKVVVYSWNVQERLVQAAVDRGAAGYLSKTITAEELAQALQRIHAGERIHASSQEDKPLVGGDWPGREQGLTARESEVIALITQGLSNQEIAERTALSINSIKSYIRSSYRKMGVTSRTNAVLWGLNHNFSPDHMRVTDPEPQRPV